MVPQALAKSTGIGLVAKMVYGVIRYHIGENPTGWPGIGTICRAINVPTPRRIWQAVQKLEATGWLIVKRQSRGRVNHYSLPAKPPTMDESSIVTRDATSIVQSKLGTNRLSTMDKSSIELGTNRPSKRTKKRTKKRTLSARAPKPPEEAAKFKALKDAIAAEFYPSGVPKSGGAAFGKIVGDYESVKATPAEIQIRAKRYRAEWPTAACTARALVAHWDQFAGGVSKQGGSMTNVPSKAAQDEYLEEMAAWKRDQAKTGPDRRIANAESS